MSLLLLSFLLSKLAFSNFSINFENGVAVNTINKFRIPGNTGSLIKLGEAGFNTPSSYFYRLNLNYSFNEKHNFKLLYAPLSFNSNGTASEDIFFDGETFNTGNDVDVFYKFNSYRLTYRYDFYQTTVLNMGIGITGKIRDAKIKLSNETTTSTNDNIGFVPLINFNLNYIFYDNLTFIFDIDALAAPQGRAEDMLLALAYKVNDSLNFNLGYRLLEGGADNDKVYTFALVNYFVLGFEYKF